MPYRFRSHIALVAREHSDFHTPELLDETVTTKEETLFALPTKDDALCITGTYDELLNFATRIMQAVYSWPLVTGHTEWLGDEITIENGRMSVDATTRITAGN